MSSVSTPVIAGVSEDQPSVILHALREAVRLGASLRIVHCDATTAGDLHVSCDPHEDMRSAGEAILAAARHSVERSCLSTHVEYVLAHGDPGTCLVEESADACVVVVGADDATWLERMLGGDVSGHVALNAGCPVVVVPRRLSSSDQADGVVVTLDGDTSSAGPLRYGFEQADYRVEELHVLHATPPATSEADTASIVAHVTSEVARWNAQAPNVRVTLSLTNGDALAECVAATTRASLLVIGRPHGQAHSFALTRPVAMLVLREARCPVAIVPADYGSLPVHA